MMKQKRSRIFRALLCSSALMGVSSQAVGQDGVARVGYQPPLPPGPGEQDGVATPDGGGFGTQGVPGYQQLPQFIPPGNFNPLVAPARRTAWQDEIGPRFRMETRIGEFLGRTDSGQQAFIV